ncbi:Transcriptional repressor smtB homolog [Acholeplasma oculi]|jgi:DNA-binding transcriptional ArsR family regulator|uniref:HTH transcriptional regulator, ArsR n=1 Tax=Acholeplasma oculi TaxID=35623 RepID=A0A061AAS8_9MOLU|nr:metalloregulator ArsR/SmtB family transcription factor [Acholeplasma oculi]CDR30948.1 HTH transcriptional regulator, ArsR [Acholeplasma oculi]SKC35703.1 DNA-binding transcriptional regulator, ArsR family [Acholeplasma oculi]SUT90248.1 Transcriptional repressor smtB homolog [Acholeplasma oculi]
MKENDCLLPDIEHKVSILFKTISDPTRIKIIYALKNKELSVNEIVDKLEMTQSAVSHQLKTLRDVNLVTFQKKGKEVYYKLADNHVYMIFDQAIEHVEEK